MMVKKTHTKILTENLGSWNETILQFWWHFTIEIELEVERDF